MRSRPRPSDSARAALCRADSTSAARVTSAALRGSSAAAFSFIIRVARPWSRLPQFTPIRTGRPYSTAASIMVAKRSSRFSPNPTLPGLIRYLASARAHSGKRVRRRSPL